MYTVEVCIHAVHTVHLYSTGLYVHYWYSHTLYRMWLSVPKHLGNTMF